MNNLTNRLNVQSSWTSQTDEVYQQQIFSYDREYSTVVALLDGRPKSNMKTVYKVQCPYLYHRYMLRKKEYEVKAIAYEEKLLLHATDQSKVQSILKDNFDWRKVYRAKFGKGVSFSPSAAYANQECSRSNGLQRAIIIAKVLVGKIQGGVRNQLLPSSNYDTTVGNFGSVYVKYYDDEFYPEYVVYYYDY